MYNEIIEEENKIMRELAVKNNIKLVDNAKTFPLNEKYFVDTVHFSHEGMKKLAENFSVEFKIWVKLYSQSLPIKKY